MRYLSAYFCVELLKLVRRYVVIVTVNPDCIIERVDVFKDKPVGMMEILNPEMSSHSRLISEWKDLIQVLS